MARNKEPHGKVRNYWACVSSDEEEDDDDDEVIEDFDLNPKDIRHAKACCLYLINKVKVQVVEKGKAKTVVKDRHYLYVVSQSILDALPEVSGMSTSHIKAMARMTKRHPELAGKKFRYIVGFYYENGGLKMTSCANVYFDDSREAPEHVQKDFKENILPRIRRRLDRRL